MSPPHLMTLADLSVPQIRRLLSHSFYSKQLSLPWLEPHTPQNSRAKDLKLPSQSLFNKTVALMFNKRSTRTRLAAETSTTLLGGRALFLGKDDIQLGVNESARDTARIVGGMCQGIFARVGDHSEIEELAKYSPVPVINALSSYWHPTQILADLLTLHEHAHLFPDPSASPSDPSKPDIKNAKTSIKTKKKRMAALPELRPLTVAYVGDSANVLHDMLVTYPRLGHSLRVASPPKYRAPPEVWKRVEELGCDKGIWWGEDPKEAVHGADVVVTDTWISMGQEAEKAQRLQDFQGYQVTEQLCREGGANPDWKFMHCLPRKPDEVDDEVFYGPRSLVFPEADNRKWSMMALFDLLIGKWNIYVPEAEAAAAAAASKRS
ncbi:ornithine carbamoyltransferase 1 [Dendrothele bispora CBS 962.96]|uniref:ornithine carbamoyltransferase n=1 Tax=Dendrothele bispora (strain CBS 962.96) TaxID=1314807 RepID=A0A4S8LPT4_DENBC|nr:ornithine carbamoyltransferase 1 [Dendrothele bispora CBS 962.96]